MIEINIIKTQRALSKTQISLADFVLNPYRGCSLGCKYCYSQENKNIVKRKKEWGSFLDIKINFPEKLKEELKKTKPKRVILGTTTECFQPQEEKFKITEKILKILKEETIPIIILTKSSLIQKYIDYLNYHPQNKVYFSLIFSNKKVRTVLEERTANLQERIDTIEKLLKKNIQVKIHIGPFIPFLEDLKNLFKLIPPQIKEVEIEIYNAKVGNFEEIIKSIEKNISEEIAKKIKEVYSEEKNYLAFSKGLIKEAKRLNKDYNFQLNFIVPQFNFWYTNKIVYEP